MMSRKFRHVLDSQEGSVLLLGMGLAVVALMCATFAINFASAWVARTHLDSITETCALAGAQAVDTSQIYQDVPVTQMNPSLARSTDSVRRCLSRNSLSDFAEIGIHSVTVKANRVTVELIARTELPFGYLLGQNSVLVTSRSSAVHLWSGN